MVGGSGGSSGPKDGGVVRDSGPEAAQGPEAGSKSDVGSTVTYTSQIKQLLDTNCTSCHGGANPQSGIDLSSYANASKNASIANSVIQSGAMPPAGALSTANKQLFQSWVTAGTPQ